jgi:osmotically-inducible protein OsmY
MVDPSRTPLTDEEDALEAREPAGYRQSDASIKEQILRDLALDEDLDASGITVDVHDGEVTLNGRVRRYADTQRVEEHACAIKGVKLVRNGLTSVEPPPLAVDGAAVGAAPKMGKPRYER